MSASEITNTDRPVSQAQGAAATIERVLDADGDAAGRDFARRLRALCDAVDGRIVFTTSFGIEDQAIAHVILTERLPVDIVTLDTGRLFRETRALWKATEQRYATRIAGFAPDPQGVVSFIAAHGIDGFYTSHQARLACCHVRKVAPLAKALARADAWVVGLRADQSQNRSDSRIASWEDSHGVIKFAPLADYSREEIVQFCTDHDVPVNLLHAKGYPSIGCEPCTRAIRPGEDERAGRWWWESDAQKECGLHVDADGRLVRAEARP